MLRIFTQPNTLLRLHVLSNKNEIQKQNCILFANNVFYYNNLW